MTKTAKMINGDITQHHIDIKSKRQQVIEKQTHRHIYTVFPKKYTNKPPMIILTVFVQF